MTSIFYLIARPSRHSLSTQCILQEEGTRDQIVQLLLESGADVNKTDREGRSPLIHACKKRCNDIVRILIHHHNIKPDIEDVYGEYATRLSSLSSSLSSVSYLSSSSLIRSSNISSSSSSSSSTPSSSLVIVIIISNSSSTCDRRAVAVYQYSCQCK